MEFEKKKIIVETILFNNQNNIPKLELQEQLKKEENNV